MFLNFNGNDIQALELLNHPLGGQLNPQSRMILEKLTVSQSVSESSITVFTNKPAAGPCPEPDTPYFTWLFPCPAVLHLYSRLCVQNATGSINNTFFFKTMFYKTTSWPTWFSAHSDHHHLNPTNIYTCHFNDKNVTFCQQSEFLHSANSQNRQW